MRQFNKRDIKTLFEEEKTKTAFNVFDSVYEHIKQILTSKGKSVSLDKLPGSWRSNWVVNSNYHGTVTLYETGLMITYCSSSKPRDHDDYFVEKSVINYHELGKLVPIEGLVIKSCTLYEIMNSRELQVVLVFADE
jgi:hypothetical protein